MHHCTPLRVTPKKNDSPLKKEMNSTTAVAVACMASHTPWIVLTAALLVWLNPPQAQQILADVVGDGVELLSANYSGDL